MLGKDAVDWKVYMIDFGLSNNILDFDGASGKATHVKFSEKKVGFTGSLAFASLNSHIGTRNSKN